MSGVGLRLGVRGVLANLAELLAPVWGASWKPPVRRRVLACGRATNNATRSRQATLARSRVERYACEAVAQFRMGTRRAQRASGACIGAACSAPQRAGWDSPTLRSTAAPRRPAATLHATLPITPPTLLYASPARYLLASSFACCRRQCSLAFSPQTLARRSGIGPSGSLELPRHRQRCVISTVSFTCKVRGHAAHLTHASPLRV